MEPRSGLAGGILLMAVTGGCAPRYAADVVDADGPPPPRSDPETVFSALEERLMAEPLAMRFRVTAQGAVRVSLAGELRVGPQVVLRAEGEFAGQRQDLHLWTEGDRLLAGPPDALAIDQPRPGDLESSLLLGLTRMGVLHNLAMLSGGAAPDHAERWDDRWVQVTELHRPSSMPKSGDVLEFSLVVAGEPSGHASLWLDDDGVPLRREQVVEFPDGTMRVEEHYEVLESALVPGAG